MKHTYLMTCSFFMASLTTSPVETKSGVPHPAWSSNIVSRDYGIAESSSWYERVLADLNRKLAMTRRAFVGC